MLPLSVRAGQTMERQVFDRTITQTIMLPSFSIPMGTILKQFVTFQVTCSADSRKSLPKSSLKLTFKQAKQRPVQSADQSFAAARRRRSDLKKSL